MPSILRFDLGGVDFAWSSTTEQAKHRVWSAPGSPDGVGGDRVAQGLQFADVRPGLALGVAATGVVVGAEVDELGPLIGEDRREHTIIRYEHPSPGDLSGWP